MADAFRCLAAEIDPGGERDEAMHIVVLGINLGKNICW